MRTLICAAAIAAIAGSALADDTDPAVITCEVAVKQTLKAPKSYELVSSTVIGHEVLISYDAVNEYNAPLRHTQRCEFYLSAEGEVSLVPLKMRQLIRAAKALTERTKTLKTAEDAERLQKDAATVQLATTSEMLRILTIGAAVKKETTYPIPLSETQVKPLPKIPSAND